MIYILIGIAVVFVIGIIAFIISKGTRDKPKDNSIPPDDIYPMW